jgi:hypothetical protein
VQTPDEQTNPLAQSAVEVHEKGQLPDRQRYGAHDVGHPAEQTPPAQVLPTEQSAFD